MTIRRPRYSPEEGLVSLLTVLFFMIFISLIVVGYMSLVARDQRQTIDNDLSASALAAARSGVEDGKRILLYCQANPAAPGCGTNVLNSQDNCNLFRSTGAGSPLIGPLGLSINAAGEGSTGTTTAYQQYFTCLTIQHDTPFVTGTAKDGAAYIQQLRAKDPYTEITIKWRGEGTYANRGVVNAWPKESDWKNPSGASFAPLLNVQLIPYAQTDLANLDALERRTRTVYVAPCDSSPACSSLRDVNALDQRSSAAGTSRVTASPLTYGSCLVVATRYECSVTLTGLSGGGASPNQYYVRIGVLYATQTEFDLSLGNGTDVVRFEGVQPWIDVTGRANDVFRRIRTQVSFIQTVTLPQHALETAAPICKDMIVTNDALSSRFNCN